MVSGRRIDRGAESSQQTAWHDAVHDVAGELGRIAGAVEWAAGGCNWNAGSESWTPGDRKADWILRQYIGVASRCFGIAKSKRVARAGEDPDDCSARASGHSI